MQDGEGDDGDEDMEAASEDLPPGEGDLDPFPPVMAVRKPWADTGRDDDHLRDPRTPAPQAQGPAENLSKPS